MVNLSHLRKSFGTVEAVRDVSLEIQRGEFIAIVGPSGCGKTTLLRLIAGFEKPDSGTFSLDGRDVTPLPPQSRHIGMVFQNYALFPHMTVRQNIEFGLKAQHRPAEEIRVRTAKAAEQVRLSHKLDVSVPYLSGGEQQRVALARAIVTEPALLLLDEPLSNLDPVLRDEMRSEIARVQRATGLTTIHVTHDQAEAMALADRIVVMQSGTIEQQSTPKQIFFQPANVFVAAFMGNAQLVPATVLGNGAGQVVTIANGITIPFPSDGNIPARGHSLLLAIKPEAISLSPGGIPAVVESVTFLGGVTECRFNIQGVTLLARIPSVSALSTIVGAAVTIAIDPTLCSLFSQ